MEAVDAVLANPIALLFLTIAGGLLIGAVPLGRVRLGGSGVLIAGLVAGHFGYLLPKILQSLGVVMFVYAVGLKAGPQIWQSLSKSKGKFFAVAGVTVMVAGVAAWVMSRLFGFSPALMAGIYAGALTSTPALAAAMDAVGGSSPTVGYGLAYPLGILGVILTVQFLPALLRTSLKDEARAYREQFHQPVIERKCFRVTNPNVTEVSLAEAVRGTSGNFRIVRVRREDRVFTPHADSELHLGDLVLAVGVGKDLESLRILLGEATQESIPESDDAHSQWITLTSKQFIGKALGQMEISSLYGVIITRVRRSDAEFVPNSNFIFEAGDEIRISGTPADLERFTRVVGRDRETLYETDIFSLAAGLMLGTLVGLVRIPLGGGLQLSLGLAGGPLMAGIVLGYMGRFGKLSGRMPKAAQNMMGEFGLYLFLAVAGGYAGEHFVEVLRAQGAVLILCGFLLTLLPIICVVLVGRFLFHLNLLVLLGLICGSMTSTPALGVLTKSTRSDIPALSYAAIYPVAVIVTTLMAQVIAGG